MAALNNILGRGFYAFERKFYTEMDRRLGNRSYDLYRREMARYHSDPDVRRAAEVWEFLLRDPRNAKYIPFVAGLAGTGSAIYVAKKAPQAFEALESVAGKRIPRRTILRVLAVPLYASALGASYGCPGTPTTPTPNPDPNPNPNPQPGGDALELEGDLEGLIKQTKVNGTMHVPGALLPVDLVNGHYKIEKKHGIRAGIHPNTVIETSEGVKRITSVEANPSGFMIDIGFRKVHLDVIDDKELYALWVQNARRDGGMMAWADTNFNKFFYNQSLWHFDGFGSPSAGYTKIRDNYTIPGRGIEGVLAVANNHFSRYTGIQIPNGIILESQSAQRPKPREMGWIVYFVADNLSSAIERSDAPITPSSREIGSAFLAISDRDLRQFADQSPQPGISWDTWESLGNRVDRRMRPIDDDGNPSVLAQRMGFIHYFRKPGQTGTATDEQA